MLEGVVSIYGRGLHFSAFHCTSVYERRLSATKMSVYFESLDDKAKARYRTKLELAGLSLQSDPYAPENQEKFQEDMTAWPPVEYGHIFAYFVRRPGVYTQDQLLSWKQMDAYNYFQSGNVRTV